MPAFNYPDPNSRDYIAQLNRSGDMDREQRQRFAEENAANTRDLGNYWSQVPQQAMTNYRSGVEYDDRLKNSQMNRDVTQAEEGRNTAREGREADRYKYEQGTTRPYNEKLHNLNLGELEAAKQRQDAEDAYKNQTVGAEEASSYGLKSVPPGMTRRQLSMMLGDQSTGQDLKNRRLQGDIYSNDLATAAEKRNNDKLQMEIDAAIASSGPDDYNARVQQTAQQLNIPVEKAAQITPPTNPKTQGVIQSLASKYKMDEGQVAARFAKSKREMQANQNQMAQTNDLSANLNQITGPVREKAVEIKNQVASLRRLKEIANPKNPSGYAQSANVGFGGAYLGSLKQGLGVDSAGQEAARTEAVNTLGKLGLPGLASDVAQVDPTRPVDTRIKDALKAAVVKVDDDLKALMDNNKSIRDDRVIQETQASLIQLKQELAKSDGPEKKPRVSLLDPAGTAPGGPVPSWKSNQVGAPAPAQAPMAPQQASYGTLPVDPFQLQTIKKNRNQSATQVK